jgi:hypothetical protein
MTRIAVAVVSEPARLSLRQLEGEEGIMGTDSWSSISDSASSCVNPWAIKEPSMSLLTFLFGPNLSPASSLATLQKVS